MTRSSGSAQASQVTAQVADMFAQSAAVLARPAPRTFERFERRGGLGQALLYVVIAAAVSALVGALFAGLNSEVTFFGQLFSRLIGIPTQFLIFTGAVYLIGKHVFRGTGSYPEVAYSFALFFVPLSIVGSLLGIIPLLGWFVVLPLVWLAMVVFGFFAVQSSMNLRDPVGAGVTLVLASLAYLFIGAWLI